MVTDALHARAQRLVAVMMIFLAAMMAACGLSEREKAVASTNSALEDVDSSHQAITEAIAALSSQSEGGRDCSALLAATEAYRENVATLDEAIRALGATSEQLNGYVTETYLPAREAAASDCQQAVDLLSSEQPSDDDIRQAITLVGRCVSNYADAFNAVVRQYSELSE